MKGSKLFHFGDEFIPGSLPVLGSPFDLLEDIAGIMELQFNIAIFTRDFSSCPSNLDLAFQLISLLSTL